MFGRVAHASATRGEDSKRMRKRLHTRSMRTRIDPQALPRRVDDSFALGDGERLRETVRPVFARGAEVDAKRRVGVEDVGEGIVVRHAER